MDWTSRTGIPHYLDKDDEYNGCFIPGQSIVIGNAWQVLSQPHSRSFNQPQFSHRVMLHDEKDYPDPERFNLERFLKNGLSDLAVRDPATIMSGFGRRWAFYLRCSLPEGYPLLGHVVSACPAAHIGLSTMWIMAASVLSTFDILKPLDEYRMPIEPTMECNSSLMLCA